MTENDGLTRREFATWGLYPLVSVGESLERYSSRFAPRPTQHWRVVLTRSSTARPLLASNDSILVSSDSGHVYSLSPTTGSEQWQFAVRGREPFFDRRTGNRELVCVADDTGTVYALDRSTGAERWRFEEENYDSRISATVSGSTVYCAGKALTAISTDGEKHWRRELPGDAFGDPLPMGDTVIIGSWHDKVHAYSADDGVHLWQYERPSDEFGRAELYPIGGFPFGERTDDRTTYSGSKTASKAEELVIVWGRDGDLRAIDVAGGSERWNVELDDGNTFLRSAIGDGTVYAVDGQSLVAVSAASGTEEWRFNAGSEIRFDPEVGDESVYVTDSTTLYALSARDGTVRWLSPIEGERGALITKAPGDAVVFDDRSGTTRAVSRVDGTVLWSFDHGLEAAWWPQATEDVVILGTLEGVVSAIGEPTETHLNQFRQEVANADATVLGGGMFASGLLGAVLGAAGLRRLRSVDEGSESVVRNDFEPQESVGEGPTGEVHRARTPDGERVALKRFVVPVADALETWANLDHDGVLEVHEWGTDPEPWVATAYADGGNLRNRLDDLDREGAVEVVSSVAETVHRAHREGVAHGRLHPGNVLFEDGEVRVGDWLGAATRADLPRGYAAPQGEHGVAPVAADVYQLGVLAVHVLTGESPSEGEIDAEGLSEELTGVLATTLAPGPDERYDSALRFRDMFRWAAFRGR